MTRKTDLVCEQRPLFYFKVMPACYATLQSSHVRSKCQQGARKKVAMLSR